MLLIDLTHTSHTRARTGVQRVCRSLQCALDAATPTAPIVFDRFACRWRGLSSSEQAALREGPGPAARVRGARWSWPDRLRGRWMRYTGRISPPVPGNARALLMPEIFSPDVARNLSSLAARFEGPRVALFHDAIALKLPEISPPRTVARFPGYLQELLQFDGIAAVSEDSRCALLDYWRWLGATVTPPVVTLSLGIDPVPSAPPEALASPDGPVVLCVSTLEGRKNHLELLAAAEILWAEGVEFELWLIGLTQPVTGRAAARKIKALQAQGHSLRYFGPVDDATLEQAYAACTFTVYPSLLEGFGLPVLESLQRGRPCVCSSQGALGESARGGGCLTVEHPERHQLARALRSLLDSPEVRARLRTEAQARAFRPWSDYARDLLTWMQELDRRA